MVYNGNSWISYDDETTFKLKIDYANGKGLAGLMVWAVDLDNANLNALKAISDADYIDSDSSSSPVDLTKIFPSEMIPSSKASKYGLVNIGSAAANGETDPSKTGFGFFLVTSDSYATTSLRKRAGEPEPFTFIDCPRHVLDQPADFLQSARVVCLNENIEDCFRVLERGVEGTLVEMPDNVRLALRSVRSHIERKASDPSLIKQCGRNSIARAVSLTRAAGKKDLFCRWETGGIENRLTIEARSILARHNSEAEPNLGSLRLHVRLPLGLDASGY